MKITLKLPRRENVGFRIVRTQTRYFDDRPLVPNSTDFSDIHEVRLVPTTIFDYDFHARRRAAATVRLLWKTTAALTLVPVAVTALSVAHVALAAVASVWEATEEVFGHLRDIHRIIVSAIRHELNEVAR